MFKILPETIISLTNDLSIFQDEFLLFACLFSLLAGLFAAPYSTRLDIFYSTI